MITHLIALVIGFIAGALVFRNKAIVQKGSEVVDKASIAVKSFKK